MASTVRGQVHAQGEIVISEMLAAIVTEAREVTISEFGEAPPVQLTCASDDSCTITCVPPQLRYSVGALLQHSLDASARLGTRRLGTPLPVSVTMF